MARMSGSVQHRGSLHRSVKRTTQHFQQHQTERVHVLTYQTYGSDIEKADWATYDDISVQHALLFIHTRFLRQSTFKSREVEFDDCSSCSGAA